MRSCWLVLLKSVIWADGPPVICRKREGVIASAAGHDVAAGGCRSEQSLPAAADEVARGPWVAIRMLSPLPAVSVGCRRRIIDDRSRFAALALGSRFPSVTFCR